MDREQVLYTVGSVLAIYGIAYFTTALGLPRFFYAFFALEQKNGRLNGSGIGVWARGILTLAGLGYFVYRSTAPLADWLPFDWGSHDEDGEWTSARETLRLGLTLWGTLWAILTAERIAKTYSDPEEQ